MVERSENRRVRRGGDETCPWRAASPRASSRGRWACGLAALGLWLAGCAEESVHRTRPGGPVEWASGPDPVTALVGPQVGMQIQAVAVRATLGAIAKVLQAYERADVPMDPATADAWARCGLRVTAVSVSDALALRERLISVGPAVTGEGLRPMIAGARQSMILAGLRYGEVARGARQPARTLGLHDTRLQAPAGYVRVLGRCWLTPAPGAQVEGGALEAPAALRVQLVPQIVKERERGVLRDLGIEAAPTNLAEQGLTLWRLEAVATLARDTALVIVSSDGAESGSWAEIAAREGSGAEPAADERGRIGGPGQVVRTDESADEAGAGAGASARSAEGRVGAGPGGAEAQALGPLSGRVRTLGAELLEPVEEASARATRVVLIILPQTPPTMVRAPAARWVDDAKGGRGDSAPAAGGEGKQGEGER